MSDALHDAVRAAALADLPESEHGYGSRFILGTPEHVQAEFAAAQTHDVVMAALLYVAPGTAAVPGGTKYAQAVNERLNAGNITDVVIFGGDTAGSSSIASRVVDGAGGVVVTRTGSGIYHTFGPRARFPMTGGQALKAGVTVRRNSAWSTTKTLVRIRWIASDGVTVISTTNGPSAPISAADVDDVRVFATGLVSPSGAAYAEMDVVSDAVTPATGAAITAYRYVLEEVSP